MLSMLPDVGYSSLSLCRSCFARKSIQSNRWYTILPAGTTPSAVRILLAIPDSTHVHRGPSSHVCSGSAGSTASRLSPCVEKTTRINMVWCTLDTCFSKRRCWHISLSGQSGWSRATLEFIPNRALQSSHLVNTYSPMGNCNIVRGGCQVGGNNRTCSVPDLHMYMY